MSIKPSAKNKWLTFYYSENIKQFSCHHMPNDNVFRNLLTPKEKPKTNNCKTRKIVQSTSTYQYVDFNYSQEKENHVLFNLNIKNNISYY